MALTGIPFNSMDGHAKTLGDYSGQVILVVNVASRCGFTPQYEGLQALYDDKRASGFTILAFPSNDFGGQEPGTDSEIAEFCSTQYSVTFPVMCKISVVGDDQHPLYAALSAEVPTAAGKDELRDRFRGYGMTPSDDPDVLWNFEKFLIDRAGRVAARFVSTVSPDAPDLITAIESELASTTPHANK